MAAIDTAGFDPASFFAVVAGSLVYLLLSPPTYEQAYVFGFVSASIPAFLTAAFAYVLLEKLLVPPLGRVGTIQLQRSKLQTVRRRQIRQGVTNRFADLTITHSSRLAVGTLDGI